MRTPGAVPNLCKADSGLSAMFGILAAISSKTPAKSVNCFDGGTYEGFVRKYSGEAAALLAMLDSEDPIKIESWIHHVFSVASGPLKAFAFLTMIKPDKTSRFGASELDKLVVGPLSNILGLSESAFIEEFKDEHWKLEDNGTRN